jgi:hypothetical protein
MRSKDYKVGYGSSVLVDGRRRAALVIRLCAAKNRRSQRHLLRHLNVHSTRQAAIPYTTPYVVQICARMPHTHDDTL